jgi:hypothetical protein
MNPVIILAGSFVIVWVCTLLLVPRQVESLFRHRLWRIRDELQDHVFDGKVPDALVVENMIETMECFIQHSDQLKMPAYLAFRLAYQKDYAGAPPMFDLSGLSAKQFELLTEILDEAYRSVAFKIVAGSRAGAFFLPIWLLYFKRGAKPLAEPHKESRRLDRIHHTIKGNREAGELLTSVG